MTRKAALASGFGLAALAHVIAIGVAGGGHGWNAPIWCSLALWFAYPALGIVATRRDPARMRPVDPLAVVLAGTAICADILLVVAGDNSYLRPTFAASPVVVIAWLALWVGWQVWLAFLILPSAFGRAKTPPRY